MVNLIALSDAFTELGYTAYFVCDSRLIIVDHRILNGCNTILWATRASSCNVTAIEKSNQNIFAYVKLVYCWIELGDHV